MESSVVPCHTPSNAAPPSEEENDNLLRSTKKVKTGGYGEKPKAGYGVKG